MEFILIVKKINNTLSKKEEVVFTKWYTASKNHKAYFDKVKERKSSFEYLFDDEKNWQLIEQKIKSEPKSYQKYFAVAASIALLFSIAYYFNFSNKDSDVPKALVKINRNDKAILTLNDGQEIVLHKNNSFENSKIKTEGKNLSYKKNKKGTSKLIKENDVIEYHYLTTRKGGEFTVLLADGTKVWLNAASKLKFPTKFIKGKTREVELMYGEAYFEVSPSTNHFGDGFKVKNLSQEINVLGTHFNVKSYSNDNEVVITLKEGKVRVESGFNKGVYLAPNQQLIINKYNSKTILKEVDVDEQISWVRGYFSFNNTPLTEIAKVLTRWYDIGVVIEDKEIENLEFNGVLNKNLSIEFILNSITNTSNIIYKIDERNIRFKK